MVWLTFDIKTHQNILDRVLKPLIIVAHVLPIVNLWSRSIIVGLHKKNRARICRTCGVWGYHDIGNCPLKKKVYFIVSYVTTYVTLLCNSITLHTGVSENSRIMFGVKKMCPYILTINKAFTKITKSYYSINNV
ncbi:hypothetical protein HanXRQr2_Chr11g0516931 [Helianthus annuus]|uniref:Uncharacterized protein n=1 Tax=Helianthus annuus TaxID=4232 RepID=A0A9K3HU17_HELAN|nr:hypothetical protein HanXRQr2_Chr11g0516931 [Helianthus annuus]KAJ0877283.1 hypothetical protein HanPSC8_Chr11g0498301 [Helianthus annuus]